jgi:hypothetical protein
MVAAAITSIRSRHLQTTWKSLLQEGAADVFGGGSGGSTQPAVDVKSLHAKIGELALEKIWGEGQAEWPHIDLEEVRKRLDAIIHTSGEKTAVSGQYKIWSRYRKFRV